MESEQPNVKQAQYSCFIQDQKRWTKNNFLIPCKSVAKISFQVLCLGETLLSLLACAGSVNEMLKQHCVLPCHFLLISLPPMLLKLLQRQCFVRPAHGPFWCTPADWEAQATLFTESSLDMNNTGGAEHGYGDKRVGKMLQLTSSQSAKKTHLETSRRIHL